MVVRIFPLKGINASRRMIATCTTRLTSHEGVSRNVIGNKRLINESGFASSCSSEVGFISGISAGTCGIPLKWLRVSSPLNGLLCKESATTVETETAGILEGEAALGRTGTNGGGEEMKVGVEFFDEPAVTGGGGTTASTISEDF